MSSVQHKGTGVVPADVKQVASLPSSKKASSASASLHPAVTQPLASPGQRTATVSQPKAMAASANVSCALAACRASIHA